ncbi:MAG: tRNA lysidine(34) synthetase TilS [Armatimonas sp.]
MTSAASALVGFVRTRALFREGERVAVALSGGADSCALLLALTETFPEALAGVLHFHHGMRGSDADADAGFCAALATKCRVPCLIGLGALGQGASEGTARQARYDFLIEGAQELGATLIATAHTADDVAETVLLRILRGTSVDGLAGIPPRRSIVEGISVVRPLLAARRADTVACCETYGVTPRHDPTNDNTVFPRNRLRALLPELSQAFNPKLVEALNRLAANAEADRDYLEAASEHLDDADAATLRAAPSALRRRALLRRLRRASLNAQEERATTRWVDALESILAGGPQQDLPGGVRARLKKGQLEIFTPPAVVKALNPINPDNGTDTIESG